MKISKLICPFLILGVTSLAVADRSSNKGLCIQPEVENGMVNIISESGSVLVANVTCNSEYQLVGKKVIKCARGVWSSKAPICTRMGGCEVRDLPQVENSRRILVKPFRGNVVKYKCRTHYRLFGQNMFHCADGGKWGGGEAPVCTRPGCDESQVHQIPYGTTKKMMKGALYQFNCDEGAVLSGSPTIFCDGKSWNDTAPTCLSPPGEPSLKLRVDNEPFGRMEELAVLRAGQTVSLRCTSKGGNPVPSLTFTKNGASFGPGPKAYQNTHTFVATTEDNGAVFGCIAQNQADGRADSKTVRLNVLFPPERLTVEGPDELTSDYNARFTCKASASNLPSKLTFKLTSHHSDLLDDLVNNGLVEIEEPKEKWIDNESHNNGQGAPGWASSRSLVLKTELLKRAGQLGEHITFECQIPDPYHERRILISATKFVTLHNPIPTVELKLKVAGPSEVRYNEPAQFRCESNREDIEFTMALDQQNIKTAFTSAEYLLSAGQLEYGTNQFVLECFALDENNDKETISHTVNVLYPPGRPEITPGKALMTSGTEQKLTCEGKAGNPPAKLEWYRDSTMIESQYTLEGDMVKAEVTFTAGPGDNGCELRCEATNSAVSKPVSETITIELLPETTSTSTESVTKVEKDVVAVVPVQIVKNSIEENTDSTEKGSNTPKDDYAYYDDDQYDYYSMNNIKEKSDPYAHPEDISTNILTGIISVDGNAKRSETVQKETNNKAINDKKQEIPESSHPNSVYPKTLQYSSSPATLSVSFSCLILAFLLHN